MPIPRSEWGMNNSQARGVIFRRVFETTFPGIDPPD